MDEESGGLFQRGSVLPGGGDEGTGCVLPETVQGGVDSTHGLGDDLFLLLATLP